MSLLSLLFTLLVLFSLGDCNFLNNNEDCVETCVNMMQKNNQLEHLSYPSLRKKKDDKMTEDSFRAICDAYEKADRCLQECEMHNEQAGRIRKQTYAGIRYICIEKRKEFFHTLPCLSKNEHLATSKCSGQIEESLEASTAFSNTVINKESHHVRLRFESLCQSLGNTVSCIEPVTRESCGDDAAEMMLKFIKVGFSSFEQIYSQLGISDQLPAACRTLLSIKKPPPKSARRTLNQADFSRSIIAVMSLLIYSLFR
ncbi:hypothetical protein PFISCL1PPCAC_5927 [Pristionchus fissidentatus]|uniref:CPG4 domain-containing protein n=1 Tax=Pristionchus fissidentatus TaxID=1538716 RepID=A0AAV5V4Y9_9BILA|nr:hypothetical protein PFISCL1PPCAC_5927 [Pristionchus fissidentatus]